MRIGLFLLLSLFLPEVHHSDLHQYHISQCLIAWNDTTQSYDVSVFLFIDDLTLALETQGATDIQIEKDKIERNTSDYIQKYIHLHFVVKSREESIPFTYLGEAISDDEKGLWCYFEIPLSDTNYDQLTIRNDVLMDVFSDQKNIITMKGKNNKEGYFLLQKGDSVFDIP